ncbi:MAG TPA: creatininase family protein [Planctomycetota bacterium]|nr:creatininase family protein [Planctomycetota bacterium]
MLTPLSRRGFFTAGALAAAACVAARSDDDPRPIAPGTDERIVHLDRLTSREVEAWIKTSDVIFVPHGPISGHGPWTTLGIHPHGAEAVSVRLARKCGGLVYPTIYTAFAGATRMYPGTVPFSYELHVQILKAVVRSLYAQGFGRIFLVAFTNPEDLAGTVAARDLFDIEGEIPVAALLANKGMSCDAVKKLLADYKGDAGEAIYDYAAMQILHHERGIAEPELAKVGLKSGLDQNAEIRDDIRILRRLGARGFRYDAEREHSSHGTVGLTYEGKSDVELGVKLIDALADYLLPAVEALKHHRDYLKAHPAKRIEKMTPLDQ